MLYRNLLANSTTISGLGENVWYGNTNTNTALQIINPNTGSVISTAGIITGGSGVKSFTKGSTGDIIAGFTSGGLVYHYKKDGTAVRSYTGVGNGQILSLGIDDVNSVLYVGAAVSGNTFFKKFSTTTGSFLANGKTQTGSDFARFIIGHFADGYYYTNGRISSGGAQFVEKRDLSDNVLITFPSVTTTFLDQAAENTVAQELYVSCSNAGANAPVQVLNTTTASLRTTFTTRGNCLFIRYSSKENCLYIGENNGGTYYLSKRDTSGNITWSKSPTGLPVNLIELIDGSLFFVSSSGFTHMDTAGNTITPTYTSVSVSNAIYGDQ